MYQNAFPSLAVVAISLLFATVSASAKMVTITTAGRVKLSEINSFAEEDSVTGSFTYDTATEGETFTTNDGTVIETEYTGITASFKNSSGTFAADTTDATIRITRVSPDSTRYSPRHELRLFFPDADIPAAGTNHYAPFIGFLTFNDRTLSTLKDGKLPAALDLNDFQTTRFLFAWNRIPGDEAPLEYGGTLLWSSDTSRPTLNIRPGVELLFTARSGFTFQIEYSDDLRNWFSLGDPIQGDGTTVSRPVATADTRNRMFRVRPLSEDN